MPSIATKKGDSGETDLLFARRVPKTHPRVAVVGALDELNAALGVARATAVSDEVAQTIPVIQDALTGLMGETGILPEDAQRYRDAGYQIIKDADLEFLDAAVTRIEAVHPASGWAQPGSEGSPAAAHLDVARTTCRRAERTLWQADETPGLPAQYLNRLSDVLWLLARAEAAKA